MLWKAKGQRPAEKGSEKFTEGQQLNALFRACVEELAEAHSPRTLWKKDLTLIVYHAD